MQRILSFIRTLAIFAISIVPAAVYAQTAAKSAQPAAASGTDNQAGVANPESLVNEVGTRFADGIAAVVEDKIITVGDIRREIIPILPQIRASVHTDAEFKKALQQYEDEIIQNLADQILIVKDFQKKGQKEGEQHTERHVPASYIDERIHDQITNQFGGDRAKFLAYLRSIGKTTREYRQMVEDDIIVQFMRGQMRKSQSIVSPVKIENYYKDNKDRFYQGDSVHLRLIRLKQLADENQSVLMQSADNIIDQLKSGSDFGKLAKEYSQDSRAKQGGDWGWIDRSDLKPELANVAFSLTKGQYSQPIKSGNDIFILYVEDKRLAGIQPLSEVRDQIEQILVSQMARDAQEKWLERLRRDAYVRYFN